VLDVVYNHTCEGDHVGPTYSFKGFDPSGYYMEGFKSKLMATLRNLFDGSCAFKIHWLSAGRQYPPGPPLRTEAPPNIHD